MNEEEYHARFHDIINGKSRIWFQEEGLFCLHPTPQIKSVALLYYQDWKQEAEARGVPNNEQAKLKAINDGSWSEEKEEEIKGVETALIEMRKTYDSITLPSQKVKQNRLIKKESSKLEEILNQKQEAFGKTSEMYATTRSNQELVRLSVVDKYGNLVWEDRDDFDDLEYKELGELNKSFVEINNRLSENIIQHMVLQDFFYIYMPHCESPTTFFGKPMVELSVFQLKTATYGNIFFNIMQRNENLSEKVKKDPEQLLAISDSKKKQESHSNRSDAKTYFGASKEDIDALTADGEKAISLSDKIKEISKDGRTVSGKDVAKIFG